MTYVVQDLLVVGPVELVRQFEGQLRELGEDRIGGHLAQDLLGGAHHVPGEQSPLHPLRPQGAFVAASRVVAVPGPGHAGPAVERDDHPPQRDPRRRLRSHHAPVFIAWVVWLQPWPLDAARRVDNCVRVADVLATEVVDDPFARRQETPGR